MGLNRVHLMMASNNAFAVPAFAESRRFAVFDVSNVHRQGPELFPGVATRRKASQLSDPNSEGSWQGCFLITVTARLMAANNVRRATAWASLPTPAVYSQKRTGLATFGRTMHRAKAHHRKLTMLPTLSELVRPVAVGGSIIGAQNIATLYRLL
jgi:hypothetical protein